jgi:hypothetical protein
MIELGSVPNLDHSEGALPFAVDFIPVNYLANVMRDISTSDTIRQDKYDRDNKVSVYHVSNPAPLNLRDLPALMPKIRADAKEGSMVPLQEWLVLMKAKAKTEVEVLRLAAFKGVCESGHVMFALDRSETLKALKMVGGYEDANNCPAIDENFLRVLGIH